MGIDIPVHYRYIDSHLHISTSVSYCANWLIICSKEPEAADGWLNGCCVITVTLADHAAIKLAPSAINLPPLQ